MTTIVFGTRNAGKVREVARLLAPYDVQVTSLLDHPDLPDAVEDADTFAGNALIKAQYICDNLGCLALADDSGLVVDALDGRPGVYSARYGGPGLSPADKNRKLLGELADVPDDHRTARFVCVLVAAQPGDEPRQAEGTCEGHILHAPRGEGGFGYDPIFGPVEAPGLAMAELPPDRKNVISHRGRATAALLPDILALLGIDPA
jgi:XTP/dITP diphosphohydrolase